MQEQQNLEPAIVSNLLCNASTLSGSERGMYRIEIKNLNKMHELLKHRIDHRINFTKILNPKLLLGTTTLSVIKTNTRSPGQRILVNIYVRY